jgi:ribosomal protein S18 acetylase RimI-like enzyme
VSPSGRPNSAAGLDSAGAEGLAPEVLSWVHESGNPYYDWFFGGPERARSALADWMTRPSSEVFEARTTLMVERGRVIGGYIALSEADLRECRAADAVASIRAVGRAGIASLRERLEAARLLFPPPEPGELYLSKMGLLQEYRGAGRGRALLEEFLAASRARGFRRFRLDVWTQNRPALCLYRSVGFETVAESRAAAADLTYAQMSLER